MNTNSIKTQNTVAYSSVYPVGAYYWGDGSVVGGDDEPGDNNWPDDDTPKQPSPNPPTPGPRDPVNQPDPHNPDVPDPTDLPQPSDDPTEPAPTPTNEPDPTNTTPQDYTPWLQAILAQLRDISDWLADFAEWLGDEMANHCLHIREEMVSCTNSLQNYLHTVIDDGVTSINTNVTSQVGYVVDSMDSMLDDHEEFLSDLAKWIVEHIDFNAGGGEFDDSNMIYWLRRIYSRQGVGDVNTRPVDVTLDYDGFSTWLGVLYDELALDVSDTSLMSLNSSLTGLQHTFPFSLPWDIKQVMQALDVSPVTPSATIPSGTNGVSYNVDLHWMDSAMVSVRAFELLVFIVYVMVHTKDLFGYLMGD